MTSAITDTEGGWTSGAATVYTVQTPGRYLIVATAGVAGSSGTDNSPRGIAILVNGSTVRAVRSGSGGTDWCGQATYTTFLAANATVSFALMQQSGASQNTDTSGGTQPVLELIWVGAN
jgi:hypothetical protein